MKSTIQNIVKSILLVILYFSLNTMYAQVPQKMSYQAVVRNASNALITNTTVGVKISIIEDNTSSVFVETHSATTNANGLLTITIGTGSVITGNLSLIPWNDFSYSIKSEIDPTGGTNYTIIGNSQMGSVPYAFQSITSADNKWAANGINIGNVNGGNVGIGTDIIATNAYGHGGTNKILEINNGSTPTNSQSQLVLSSNATSAGSIGGVNMVAKGSTLSDKRVAYVGSTFDNTGGNMGFWTNNGGTLGQRMIIDKTGNVGIGTINPFFPLSFPSSYGEKISIYGNASARVGFAVQPSNFQILGDTSGTDITFGYGLSASAVELLRIKGNSGNVGIGTATPTTKLEVNGFTKLGTDAPAIKVKKITGTTSATQNGSITITHGLNAAKILSVTVLVEYTTGSYVPASYSRSGYEFDFFIINDNIYIWNSATNSSAILSKPVKIMITYEE